MRRHSRRERHDVLVSDGHEFFVIAKIEHETEVIVFGNLARAYRAHSRSRQIVKPAIQWFAVVEEPSYLPRPNWDDTDAGDVSEIQAGLQK